MSMNASWIGKVGGSLLKPPDLQDLPARLDAVLTGRGGGRPLLVVGGGPTVDLIRDWDRQFGFDEEFGHWAAVHALTLNSRIVAQILPGACFAANRDECELVWSRGETPVYPTYNFLSEVDARLPDALPRRWSVTSDSIAARLARETGAAELALLKSTTVPDGTTIEDAACDGIVDGYFAEAARTLPSIVSINLRADPAVVTRLLVAQRDSHTAT